MSCDDTLNGDIYDRLIWDFFWHNANTRLKKAVMTGSCFNVI